jgi:DNA-binding NtrC family response regulator
MKEKIIIIEDNQTVAQEYEKILKNENRITKLITNSTDFWNIYKCFKPDLIILDIKLGSSSQNGIEIFHQLSLRNDFDSEVILISGEAQLYEVADGMRLNPFSFIDKNHDFDENKFKMDVTNAIKCAHQKKENKLLMDFNRNLKKGFDLISPFIGECSAIKEIKKSIRTFAAAGVNVTIIGETGTGKEIVANHIYLNSKRVGNPFVKINSGAIPDTLIDSELFGFRKGAFTGAVESHEGLFIQANSGYIFLDEISAMTPLVQTKLLRVLDNKEIRIIGGKEVDKIDVNIIFGSNKDLQTLKKSNLIREDFYYRISHNCIYLPPLRERENDIVLLAKYFIGQYCFRFTKQENIDYSKLQSILQKYDWPGNIRELSQFLESTILLNTKINNSTIQKSLEHRRELCTSYESFMNIQNYIKAMRKAESDYLLVNLKKFNNNIYQTAKHLEMNRTTLYNRLNHLNIKPR